MPSEMDGPPLCSFIFSSPTPGVCGPANGSASRRRPWGPSRQGRRTHSNVRRRPDDATPSGHLLRQRKAVLASSSVGDFSNVRTA